MEAFNVAQKENTAYVMNELFFENNSDFYVYNLGISAHNLLRVAKNFEAALQEFQPAKYVVIESSINFKTEGIETVLNGQMEDIPSFDKGALYQLQKIPYLKLLYAQYKNLKAQDGDDFDEGETETIEKGEVVDAQYKLSLNLLFKKINKTADDNGVEVIIFYHPHLKIREDGTAYPDTDAEYLFAMAEACESNNILFVDMSDIFLSKYEKEYILPHGFSNSVAGAGHMNADGHSMIAEKLVRVILDREGNR
jgi:hypothetical protein